MVGRDKEGSLGTQITLTYVNITDVPATGAINARRKLVPPVGCFSALEMLFAVADNYKRPGVGHHFHLKLIFFEV